MATRRPKPNPVEDMPAEVAPPVVEEGGRESVAQLKLKELVETIVERTGQRKGEVRTTVQAALAVMGETLAAGQEVNLPPLGKMKITCGRTERLIVPSLKPLCLFCAKS